MGYKKRATTTGKIKVPKKVLEEIKISYLHSIVQKIDQNDILHSMVINLEEAPTKFARGSKSTLVKSDSNSVSVGGANN